MSVYSFDKELEELKGKDGLEAAFVLFKVYARGVSAEQDRIIRIVQRMAIDPMKIVNEIRRPQR